MTNKHKVTLLAVMACLLASISAILASHKPVYVGILVIVLVAEALILFFAGYFAGLSRND